MSGRIPIFRGFVGWASSIEELVGPDDHYQASQILCWPQAAPQAISTALPGQERETRAALVQNKCQTASGASYYCRIGADFVADDGGLRLELAVPQDDSLGLGDLADPLWRELLGLVANPLVPSGRMRFHWARFHLVDSRLWAYRAAVHLLFHLFQPTTPWPPTEAQAPTLSSFFQTRPGC